MRPWPVILGWAGLLALGCDGSPSPATDAGADGATPGRLIISGPRHAFAEEETCFRASPVSAEAEVEWQWGPGERELGEADACHRFPFVGVRQIGVRVREPGRPMMEASHQLAVVFRPAEQRPTTSSTIALEPGGEALFVVDADAARLARIETAGPRLAQTVEVGERPLSLAVGDGVVAVTCAGEGSVRFYDAADLSLRGRVDFGAGSEPHGVLADPRGGGFFVALAGLGEVASISVDGALRARLSVGPEPHALAMNAEGALLVTRRRATLEGARVYTIDASNPQALTRTSETLLPYEEGLDSDTNNDGVLSFLEQIVPSPEGRRAVLPSLKSNTVAGLHRTGRPTNTQTTARAALGEVVFGAPNRGAEDSFRHAFDDLDFAIAAAFSPLGETLYVAILGAQVVLAVDAFDFFSVGSIDDVGEAPRGLVVSPDGARLYVHASLSRAVRVYDITNLSNEPPPLAEIVFVAEEPLPAQVLEGKRIFFRSRDARMSRTRYLSCASCHLDGASDGLVWDFTQRGEGLRSTIDLRGRAGVAHGPLHWSANFDEVQDFENDIRAHQGGAGFLSDALFEEGDRAHPLGLPKAGLSPELDALEAYVTSLDAFGVSPHRREGDADWEASVARGRAIFEDPAVGCATCHVAPRYTDSAFAPDGQPILHDVGTLGAGSGRRLGEALPGLDTPTLRGLWGRPHFLHDGAAASLREVLVDRNSEDRHGVTSDLGEPDLEDLEMFLLCLDDLAD